MGNFDSLDHQLVQLLCKDARQSSDALAKQLNVSGATVRRRIRKLLKHKTIRIAALADHSQVGFEVISFIGLNVNSGKLDTVINTLASRPEIIWLATTAGRFDIITLARFTSNEALGTFLSKDLVNIGGVQRSESLICLYVKKGRYLPL